MEGNLQERQNVSIRSIIILMALVTLVISALLLTATYNVDAGYTRLSANMEDYVRWQHDANDLQIGSDYLTEQVRCFVVTGKREYLDNYFEEANVTRRRDNAVEGVRSLMGETEAYEALVNAMGESVDLMNREYYAMRLAVSVCGYDLSEFPPEIQAVELAESDALASPEEQRETARKMVFDDVYHMKKVATPLLQAVTLIKKDSKLPVNGSREFQFLAREYNVMHDTNQAQKKELAYEATHDNLTGVYNRNGYDSIQRSVDWNSSARIPAR